MTRRDSKPIRKEDARGYGWTCKRDHVVEGYNAFVERDGRVVCRECRNAHHRVSSDGEGESVTCQLCGKRRRSLVQHLLYEHGLKKPLKKTYRGELVAPVMREIHRDIWIDRNADGIEVGFRRGRPAYGGICKKGLHRLSGRNARPNSRGGRECRACRNDAEKTRRATRRKELEHLGCQACACEQAGLPLPSWLAKNYPRRLLCERHLLWARQQAALYNARRRKKQGKRPSK